MKDLRTRKELIEAVDRLRYCLEQKADEDAFNWAVNIVSAIHGMSKQRTAAVTNWLDECRHRVDTVGE